MKARVEVGDVVMTRWDDADKPLRGTVVRKYEGHRGMMYQVRLDDSTEKVRADQIVKVVRG